MTEEYVSYETTNLRVGDVIVTNNDTFHLVTMDEFAVDSEYLERDFIYTVISLEDFTTTDRAFTLKAIEDAFEDIHGGIKEIVQFQELYK